MKWQMDVSVQKFSQTFKKEQMNEQQVIYKQISGFQFVDYTVRRGHGRPYSDQIVTHIAPGITCPGHSELIVSKENDHYFIELDYEAIQLGQLPDGSTIESAHEVYKFKGEVLIAEGNWQSWLYEGAHIKFVWTQDSLNQLFALKANAMKSFFIETLNFALRQESKRIKLVAQPGFDSTKILAPEAYQGILENLSSGGMSYKLKFKADEKSL